MNAQDAKPSPVEAPTDPRWSALMARDTAADGRFVYAVTSTGVYCRPSCPARRPRPDNVVFYAGPEAAAAAGFHPCKRCRPEQPPLTARRVALVAELCRFIDGAGHAPALAELAARSGLSPWHLHRVFKTVTGLTPRAYVAAQRARRVRDELPASQSVTAAIYGAGYNSNGRFYAEAAHILGMTPSQYRAGGAEREIRFAVGRCWLGAILVAQSARGVCAILLGDDGPALVADLRARFRAATLIAGDADFERVVADVVAFVEAPRIGVELPLDLRGTVFQQRVWQALRTIPAGQTASYGEIATRVGAPTAVRAVASAVAANPLAVAVPCHRVVRSDGSLSGYRWGVARKKALLEREAGA